MKLLFVFPFCSAKVNSIAGGPIYLGSIGHQVLVITSRHADSLKGKVDAEESERIGETEFFRPFNHSLDLIRNPYMCWDRIQSKLSDFKPDAVICFGEFNYRLPMRISRELGIPMYLYMEYLRPEKIAFPMRGRSYLRRALPFVHDYLARKFMQYLLGNVQAVMYAYFGDQKYAKDVEKKGVPAYYVPWCAEVVGEESEGEVERERNVGIHIGSLEGFKNAAELVKAIPLILENTGTERFIVVGPGAFAAEIKKLVTHYGDRLQYIESVPRQEALRLIRSATYAYTPVTDCGLGFIGDCWGAGTPLIATHELDGFLRADEDTLIAEDYMDVPNVINQLLSSDDLHERMRDSGRVRYEADYTARAAGERYQAVVTRVSASER
jgi:glycosyltransferase involved in cell wall biosynthesis